MTKRAIVAIGISQCVNWGALYYAFAVLVGPVQRELNVSTWAVTGAFSIALLVSALAAPTVGAWCDRGRGPLVLQIGGIGAALLLGLWTLLPNVAALYAIWAGLGLCMAATLYEPAFSVVGRAHREPAARLRAIAGITLLGGLASTVFLPLTTVVVALAGWRTGVLTLAVLLVASAVTTRAAVLLSGTDGRLVGSTAAPHVASSDRAARPEGYAVVAAGFAFASLASAGFTTSLVPALVDRGASAWTAGWLGGLIGVMQLPGRALMMSGRLAGSASDLFAVSLALQSCGLAIVALVPSIAAAAIGTALFAAGAGLMTLARPYLVQTMVKPQREAHLNGRLARSQQLARAAGPIIVASLAGTLGYAFVFTLLAGAFFVFVLLMKSVPARAISRFAQEGDGGCSRKAPPSPSCASLPISAARSRAKSLEPFSRTGESKTALESSDWRRS